MNYLIKSLLLACLAGLLLSSTTSLAQPAGGGRGNRGNRANADPAARRLQMMERLKETLKVTNDDEWKVLQDLIQKVMDAQRETRGGGGFGMMMGGGRRGGQPGGGQPADAQNANNARRGGMGGGMPNPELDDLRKALDDNASSGVLKAKLASLRESRKTAESKLEKAQADLQRVVTQRQEAQLVLMGLLK